MEKNEKILNYFASLKKEKKIGPVYILIGKDLLFFARTLTKLLNCEHSDYFCEKCTFCYEAEKKVSCDIMVIDEAPSIKIEHIRQAQKFLSLRAMNLKKKVLIINHAHYLGDEAQHAFLKTLEEPPQHSLILLLTSRVDTLLPTILSRCRKVYFPLLEKYHFDDFSLLESFLRKEPVVIKERIRARAFFMDIIVFLRDTLVYQLTLDKRKLLEPASCEIILHQNTFPGDILLRLERALEIYNGLDTINLNLANNLIGVAFSSESS